MTNLPIPDQRTYLFDPQNHTTHLAHSIAELYAQPKELWPLFFLAGKAPKAMPIIDCGEKLVPLAQELAKNNSRIVLAVGEAEYGAQDINMHALREGAFERLLKAEKLLREINPNLTFKITDSFRPISLQKQYFDKIMALFAAQGLSGDALYNRTTQAIADPECHPPHSTGGTVDLTLYNVVTSQPLDMGSILDDVENPISQTFYPSTPLAARTNKVLLFNVMTEAGFVNSPSEWWHYSYGDQEWAIRTEQKAAKYDSVDR